MDKEPITALILKPLFGESTLTMPSNELWAKKRRAITVAFYKEKLIKMTEIIKDIIHQRLE